MASTAWQRKLAEAQELTNKGAKCEFSNDYSAAFQCYVRAGELYLWLVREKVGPSDTSRLRAAAEKVLSRAETIKQIKSDVQAPIKRPLSDEEQTRSLNAGCKVDSILLPEWTSEDCRPSSSHTARPLPLPAPRQMEHNVSFRPAKDIPMVSKSLFDKMRPLQGHQIVQRVVTDCSFVAALEVEAQHDAKWGTNLAYAPFYPKDDQGYPTWSSNNIYNIRLNFNGKDRCVSIDDRIPCYPDGKPMCAVGAVDGQIQVWLSILEKAYLSLRGGYHFGGSNSSVDLHALTGWIPEQIGFQHSGFQREKTWQRLKNAYDKGHVLVTAGTYKKTEKQQLAGQVSLIDSHNYAVLNMQEEENERWLTLMNPWETDKEREIMKMNWDEACSRLDSLYLNWSCNLFRYKLTWHGLWAANSKQSSSLQLIVKDSCDVWLLLTRHTTKTSPDATKEWIALHLFGEMDQQTVQRKGVYVDSTHTLLRCQLKPGTWKVAASRQGGVEETSFSLFAYSLSEIAWQDTSSMSCSHSYPLQDQWTKKTAGGNTTHSSFLHNPQYHVSLSTRCDLAVTVETSKDIPVQAVLVWSRGKRVGQVTQGDVVASSGIYNYGIALAEAKKINPGSYTLIVSTFDKDQLGDFVIKIHSNQPLQITTLPAEGAGMFHQHVRHRWLPETAQGSPKNRAYFSNPTYNLTVERNSTYIIRLLVSESSLTVRPAINVAIFSALTKREIVASGPYSDAICGVAIEGIKLEPGDYLVVVSTYEAGVTVNFTMDIYSDQRIVYKKVQG